MSADLPPAELQMLDQMLKEEMGQAAPADDLSALFEAVPVMAKQQAGVQISFDEDEEESAAGVPMTIGSFAQQASGDELDALFADNEEVQAQRQIRAAEMEQQAREGGYSVPGGRTASARGAKKIGQVQRGKAPSVDSTLENLWDRP